jgi:hypothetical protein
VLQGPTTCVNVKYRKMKVNLPEEKRREKKRKEEVKGFV